MDINNLHLMENESELREVFSSFTENVRVVSKVVMGMCRYSLPPYTHTQTKAFVTHSSVISLNILGVQFEDLYSLMSVTCGSYWIH